MGRSKVAFETNVIKEELNPVWNQTYNMKNVNIFKDKYVQFRIRDSNGRFTADDDIGSVDFFLERLVCKQMADIEAGRSKAQPTWDKKFDIKPSSDLNSRFPTRTDFGKLHLRVDVEPNKALIQKMKDVQHKRNTDDAQEAAAKKNNISARAKGHSGWLFKQGQGLLAKEETRFFEFAPPILAYYSDDYNTVTNMNSEDARRDMLKGHVNFEKELIMIRPYTMLGRGADPTQFEVLVLRKGTMFDKDGDDRTYKLRADTAQSAAVWVETLTKYCENACVTLIEGKIKKIEVIGERTLDEEGPKLGTFFFSPLSLSLSLSLTRTHTYMYRFIYVVHNSCHQNR